MKPLVRFYLGEGPDSEGRFLRDHPRLGCPAAGERP